MPYFEFSNSGNTLTLKPEFWIYWALTIPLTLVVLAAYLAYIVWIQNKERIEDLAVRKEFNALPQTDGLQDSASRRWEQEAHKPFERATLHRFHTSRE